MDYFGHILHLYLIKNLIVQILQKLFFVVIYNFQLMDGGIDYSSCQIFGFAGVIIQIILAAMSFSVLIYKRYTQDPKRPWKIWALDTSKQGISQTVAHFINVMISLDLSTKMSTCACNWYFSTNILDNTFGVFLTLLTLRTLQKFVLVGKLCRYRSGNYYTSIEEWDYETTFTYNQASKATNTAIEPQPLEITVKKTKYIISYSDWFVQLIIWNLIVFAIKIIVFYMEYALSGPIITVSDFILSWIDQFETLQLILVIIIVPVIMNGLAFWIQDNFLKKQDINKHQTLL